MTDRIRSLLHALLLDATAHLDALREIIENDGILGEDTIELQISAIRLCDELYFNLGDELHKNGVLPDDMHGYGKERQ